MRALEKIALTLIAVGALAFTATAGTLEDVKSRGELRCVVSTGIAGFAYPVRLSEIPSRNSKVKIFGEGEIAPFPSLHSESLTALRNVFSGANKGMTFP